MAGMNKNLRWKALAIVAVIALAAWMIYPIDKKIRLGLDLKGGVHLVLRVQTDDALAVWGLRRRWSASAPS